MYTSIPPIDGISFILHYRYSGGKGRKRGKNGTKRLRAKRQAVIAVENALPTACLEQPKSFDDARAANESTYAGAKFPSDQLKTVN